MEDIVADILAILAGVLILFILPLSIVTLNMDNTAQGLIDNAVVEFTDNARTTAVITAESYEKLCRAVDSAEKNCFIKITHSSKYAYSDGSDIDYLYYDYTKDDILNTIYTPTGDNQKYRMKNGDYLSVTVYSTKATLGTKIYRMVLPGFGSDTHTIHSVYSGMVGNNPE